MKIKCEVPGCDFVTPYAGKSAERSLQVHHARKHGKNKAKGKKTKQAKTAQADWPMNFCPCCGFPAEQARRMMEVIT
jgi:hypothetical protein